MRKQNGPTIPPLPLGEGRGEGQRILQTRKLNTCPKRRTDYARVMISFFKKLTVIGSLSLAVSLHAADSNLIAEGAKPEVLAEGYEFTEGPAVDKEGNIYFTDQPNDRIVKWSAADNSFTDWLKPAG